MEEEVKVETQRSTCTNSVTRTEEKLIVVENTERKPEVLS